ncbi:MAG: methionyl-tRNA formyltransferase [Gammaproteobacteria bacterium]|nr:methionyl-tRNA formyltransferase [Gammaproteobacteria bacterium]
MNKRRIIFMGTPEFAVPALTALLNAGHKVCAVYTQPDRPAGRGRKLRASAVKTLALRHDLPVYQPKTLKDPQAQAEMAGLQPDLMVVAAYGLILPQAVLDIPSLGCINVHASLLPRWRGAAPIHRALLAGDENTGISIMQVDAGLDSGPVLLQEKCPILADDTGQSLHDRMAELGAKTLVRALEQLPRLIPQPQDNSQATYAHKLEKAEAKLDWLRPAQELERQVRAFNSWPVAQTVLNGITLRVWQAKVADTQTSHAPGSIVHCDKHGIDVAAAGKSVLRLLQVQRPGGCPVAAGDFINAHPEFTKNVPI